MKLYSLALPIILFTLFGYLVHTMDKTATDGVIQKEAMVLEFEEDFHDVEAFFAAVGTANHGRYND